MSNRTSRPLVSVGSGMGGGRAGLGRWELGVAPSVWLREAEISETARDRSKGHTCTYLCHISLETRPLPPQRLVLSG